MIANCAAYERGRRRDGELSLERAGSAAREENAFVWLGLVEPSAEELEAIAREFDLHELAVEDAVKAHQRPKVEAYDDTLFVVVNRPLRRSRRGDRDRRAAALRQSRLVITVRHGHGKLAAVRERIERRPDLLRHGPGMVLYAILDHVVDGYEAAAEGVEVDIQEVERQVFSGDRGNPAERIYKLERELVDFQAAVSPLTASVDEILRGNFDVVPEDLLEYYRDVHDHLRRAAGRIHGFRELLGNALQANLTQVSVRQNEDMRKISAWVAILAVPTMIAGVYGMNFEHMPELEWEFGYPTVVVVIALVCLLLYRRFKRAGWL